MIPSFSNGRMSNFTPFDGRDWLRHTTLKGTIVSNDVVPPLPEGNCIMLAFYNQMIA